MAQGSSYAGVPPGPLSAYLGVKQANEERSQQGLGVLARLQAAQAAEQMRPLQMKLLEAKLREESQQAEARDRQAKAVGSLSDLLRTGGYSPQPGALPLTGVELNDQDALARVMAAEASGQAANVGVPNPNTVRSLAIQASPDKTIPELMKQERPNTMAGVKSVPGGYIQIGQDGKITFTRTQNGPQQGPLVSVIGPDGKPVLATRENAIGRTPAPPPTVGSNIARSPESIRDDALYQIINGTPRPGSIPTGRSGEGNEYRKLIADEIRKIADERKLTPEQLASGRIVNKANSIALNAVTKDLASITPFKEMLDTNAEVAINLGKKIVDDKTNSAYLNKPLLWIQNNLSNQPDIAEYLAQMHFVEVEAARVLSQPRLVGQLTDQAISDMKSVVSGNMTIESSERVLRRIQSDGNNRISAMRKERDGLIGDIRGNGRPEVDSMESQVRGFGYPYEPQKYDYRIENGQLQRKLK